MRTARVTRLVVLLAVHAMAVGTLACTPVKAARPAPTAPPPQPSSPSVSLISQTTWARPGSDVVLRLHVAKADPSRFSVATSVYPAVTSRSQFFETLRGVSGTPLVTPPSSPLSSLGLDPKGDITVHLPIQDPERATDRTRVSLGRKSGVFPVRVELRDRDDESLVNSFTTHLVYLTPDVGPKLAVSVVVPVHAPPALRSDGTRRVQGLDSLVSAASALDAARTVPFALAPTPETLESLAASSEERAATALATLRRLSTDHQVLGRPYVPVNLAGVLQAGLEGEATAQVERGRAVLGEALHADEPRVWLGADPLDGTALGRLRSLGVNQVIVEEGALAPMRQKLTLTRPFLIEGRQGRQYRALAADGGLGTHFSNDGNPALLAQQLLADLAVLYLDQPGRTRGVVALAPRSWKPNRQFLETLAGGIEDSPVVDAVSPDTMFTTIDAARTDAGRPLVRRLATVPADGLSDLAGDIRAARRRLEGFSSVLGRDSATYGMRGEQLLTAQSTELHSSRQRSAYVDAVNRFIDRQLHNIQMPRGRSITLTARRGAIPVTFRNLTGHPVHVVVRVQSDKLLFPQGATRNVELTRSNTTERFSVLARASGAFPLRITLVSPDGATIIGRTRLTVRSTATPGVGLVLSVGAALFLALWWGRRTVRGRRARRLVPA